MVWQSEARIEVHHRAADGSWELRNYSGLAVRVPLRSLGVELPLADVYDGIEFAV